MGYPHRSVLDSDWPVQLAPRLLKNLASCTGQLPQLSIDRKNLQDTHTHEQTQAHIRIYFAPSYSYIHQPTNLPLSLPMFTPILAYTFDFPPPQVTDVGIFTTAWLIFWTFVTVLLFVNAWTGTVKFSSSCGGSCFVDFIFVLMQCAIFALILIAMVIDTWSEDRDDHIYFGVIGIHDRDHPQDNYYRSSVTSILLNFLRMTMYVCSRAARCYAVTCTVCEYVTIQLHIWSIITMECQSFTIQLNLI